MKILSIDEATVRTGWSILECNENIPLGPFVLEYGIIKAKGNEREKIDMMVNSLISILERTKPDFVVIENIQFCKGNVHSLVMLSRLQGALEYAVGQRETPLIALDPSTWHSVLGWPKMARNDLKMASVKLCKNRYNIEIKNNEIDAADAISIGTAFFVIRHNG